MMAAGGCAGGRGGADRRPRQADRLPPPGSREADIEFADGPFRVAGTDRGIGIEDVARQSYVPGALPPGEELGLYALLVTRPGDATFPNGCHVCEVEIDPETGETALLRYVVVDDVGTVINPLLLKGQIHGGVAQGLGQILGEEVRYDAAGQILTASFADYPMPRASDLCDIEVLSNPVPTTTNPLGVKGAGEAGTVGALPAVQAAVIDALTTARRAGSGDAGDPGAGLDGDPRRTPKPGCYSTLIPAARTTGVHRSISSRRCAAKRSGVPPTRSRPAGAAAPPPPPAAPGSR